MQLLLKYYIYPKHYKNAEKLNLSYLLSRNSAMYFLLKAFLRPSKNLLRCGPLLLKRKYIHI